MLDSSVLSESLLLLLLWLLSYLSRSGLSSSIPLTIVGKKCFGASIIDDLLFLLSVEYFSFDRVRALLSPLIVFFSDYATFLLLVIC